MHLVPCLVYQFAFFAQLFLSPFLSRIPPSLLPSFPPSLALSISLLFARSLACSPLSRSLTLTHPLLLARSLSLPTPAQLTQDEVLSDVQTRAGPDAPDGSAPGVGIVLRRTHARMHPRRASGGSKRGPEISENGHKKGSVIESWLHLKPYRLLARPALLAAIALFQTLFVSSYRTCNLDGDSSQRIELSPHFLPFSVESCSNLQQHFSVSHQLSTAAL